MAKPGHVDQRDLANWANTQTARYELPRLIRRLILETAPDVSSLDFPAGEGVSTGGWDGTVQNSTGTVYVPEGTSGWEISVNSSPGKKADEDYSKRLTSPDGSPTTDCAYVQVSLRRWADRATWAESRQNDARWKTVHALGLDNVEAWLESAPVTHAWLSEQLGLTPFGLRPAESWWEFWSTATTAPIPPALLLAGRSVAAQELISVFAGTPQVTSIRADSIQEVLAFISAVAVSADRDSGAHFLARMVFVDSREAWRSLFSHQGPLILVPTADELVPEITSSPRHQIIVPIKGASDADIDLPPIHSGDAAVALREAGLNESNSDKFGRLARRSLIAARRALASKPELHRPIWADASSSSQIIRGILLAGRWSDNVTGDQEVLTKLTDLEYPALRERLAELAATDDPLIQVTAGQWSLVSPYDAWNLIGSQVRADDLQRFESIAIEVLLEIDPALELPMNERWQALVRGKDRSHSSALRSGIADNLALLGVHGERVKTLGGSTGGIWATRFVREILAGANRDQTGATWISIHEILPSLAESSPGAFIAGVRSGLNPGDRPLLKTVFTDSSAEYSLFSPTPPHTGLLWALESLARSEENFSDAVDSLARLAQIDPGGRMSNRPINSLQSIFCLWAPETLVDSNRRLRVIDALRRRYPQVSWDLMIELLPSVRRNIHFPTHKAKFRDWSPERLDIPHSEYMNSVHEIVIRIIADVVVDTTRWTEIVGNYDELPPAERELIRSSLDTLVKDSESSVTTSGRAFIWENVRSLVARHRQYSDASWSLPEQELSVLEGIVVAWSPDSPSVRHAWLFEDYMPDLGDNLSRADPQYQTRLAEHRLSAIEEIVTSGGLEQVEKLVDSAKIPWPIGTALARLTFGSYDQELVNQLVPDSENRKDFHRAYIVCRFGQEGWPWLDEIIASLDGNSSRIAFLLLSSQSFPDAWERARVLGESVTSEFWKNFRIHGLGQDFGHVSLVAAELMNVGRNAAALDLVGLYLNQLGGDSNVAQIILRGLSSILRDREDLEIQNLSSYDFSKLFEYLDSVSGEQDLFRIAQLQWALLPVFSLGAKANTLHRLLADDPEIFVEIVSVTFRSNDTEDSSSSTSRDSRIAANGYKLLSEWSVIPGRKSDGSIDLDILRDWVERVRTKLSEVGRVEFGDRLIGKMLSASPAGEDGFRPCEAIREIFEEFESTEMCSGFVAGFINQRGVTSRSPEDGGQSERRLAREYQDDARGVQDGWPRTAAALRQVASIYEAEARREDEEAEIIRRGLDS